jgi:hypothetical protein
MARSLILVMLLGCRNKEGATVQLFAPSSQAAVFERYAALSPLEMVVEETGDPAGALADASGQINVALDPVADCGGCYTIQAAEGGYRIKGDAPLGLQYGLTALLEGYGLRFLHPFDPFVPETLPDKPALAVPLGQRHTPEIARRALHMHTLHPIEGLDAFWLTEEDSADRAAQILHWSVQNRLTDVQYPGLDDVQSPGARQDAWVAHSAALVEEAELRGLRLGLGVQLFGSGNLQEAFDLLDAVGTEAEQEAALTERLAPALTGAGFHRLNLSFGEFFGEDPETFLGVLNRTAAVAQSLRPDVEMTSTVHVGDELRVSYQGEEIPYYFLAQYADPAIVPLVHTVMYYTLFDDAGGAYNHEDFSEHRQLLLDRMAAGLPVGYHPESAYWVAFDVNVPLYLPIYLWARDRDIAGVAAAAGQPLPEHNLFSSGWEWGYWQNDVMSFALSDRYGAGYADRLEWIFSPLHKQGAALGALIAQVAEIERAAFIDQRLTPWMAGRDAIMDVGFATGVVAQPDRETPAELVALSEADKADRRSTIAEPLAALSLALTEAALGAESLVGGADQRYLREVIDGLWVTALRAEFANAVVSAALSEAPTDDLSRAEAALSAAAEVVARRHADLHDPHGERLVSASWENPTLYDFGYLLRAEELCFWKKELAEVREAHGLSTDPSPLCAL